MDSWMVVDEQINSITKPKSKVTQKLAHYNNYWNPLTKPDDDLDTHQSVNNNVKHQN